MSAYKTYNEEDTLKLGQKIGEILRPGDIVCLVGDLGTGKTALTKGIAKALGIEGYITSPTFAFVNEYYGKFPLYHFDVYRIGEPEDMFEIGFDEYISGEGVSIIEWADLIRDVLPPKCIWIEISKESYSDNCIRNVKIEWSADETREF